MEPTGHDHQGVRRFFVSGGPGESGGHRMGVAENPTSVGRRTDEAWTIDSARTAVEFDVKSMLVRKVTGRFTEVSGKVVLDPSAPQHSSVDVTIGAASVTTGNTRRDTHLRSADFLDATRVPQMRFRSTGVEAVSLEHLRVTGDLTVRDVTRPIVLDARIGANRRDERGQMGIHFMAQTVINRHDFGITHSPTFMAGKTLTIRIEAQAIR